MQTTEDHLKIDIHWMKKYGNLTKGKAGSIFWSRNGQQKGCIGYYTENDRLVLNYEITHRNGKSESIRDEIFFAWTSCNYGGKRQWFLCPKCNRRVAILYGGIYFHCRHCHSLTYASQQESRSDRLRRRSRKIRTKMGGGNNLVEPFPFKPKNMHWDTYWRLRTEAEQASTRSLLIGLQQMGIEL
jgi:hypothetical protein